MSIYQHFRREEREFIDQVLNWKEYVEHAYSPKLTDFIDPREQQILSAIIGQHSGTKVDLFGGTEGTERKRALLYPEYYQAAENDFQISLFEVGYPSKFVTIEHRQVLGTLMSLGLKRGKFGDILTEGETVQFFAANEVKDYIRIEMQSIGRAAIDLNEIPLRMAIPIKEKWQEVSATASSLRLDTVVSAIYNLSRQKSQLLIQQGLVKVNWSVIENPAFESGEGDMISIRGYGRSKILSIEGKTKKEKWRIVAGKQK